MEGPWPVPRVHARPDRGVRVHALAGRGTRQQLQHHLQVAKRRHDLLNPHHRHEHLGQGRAHPAVPLGLDDDDASGVGTREVGARDCHSCAEERIAKERARRRGQLGGVVGEPFDSEPFPEQVADLAPVLVDRRHEEVRRPLPCKLHDQLRQVGLQRVDARCLERLVQPDLVGRERLHLHDLVHAFGAHDLRHDCVGLGSIPRPVDDSSPLGDRHLELDEERLEREERVVLDRRAGVAQVLPIRHLRDRQRPLRPNRGGRMQHVRPHLSARQRLPRSLRKQLRPRRPVSLRHSANTSAR